MAMESFWLRVPPAALQLKRISLALGLSDTTVQTSTRKVNDVMREAAAAGLSVMDGRPDDPMLDFLDL